MAFNVTLFNLSKKENSTQRPSNGTSFNCVLKSPSGIVNPVLEFDVGLSNVPNYNYCYIPSFNRYYWVEEWTNRGALWIASLKVDVLATYKDAIGDSNLYILRSASQWDGNIVDTFYPSKVNFQYSYQEKITPFLHDTDNYIKLNQGCVVIGVASKRGQFGSVTYYALTVSNVAELTRQLMEDAITLDNGFDMADCSLALQRSLVDPLSFIVSAVWIPELYEAMPGTVWNEIDIFDWTLSVECKRIRTNPPYRIQTVAFDIQKHPQTASRGNYLNTAPYTINTLSIPPFGLIDIDSSVTANYTTIRGDIVTDLITGMGILKVSCGTYTINRLKAQIGVPLQLSQVVKDYVGAAVSTVSNIANGISNAVMGNWGGLVGNVASGVGDAVNALKPRVSHVGGNGGFSDLDGYAKFQQQFMIAVDDDITMCGRPLCQIKKPKDLGGYMVVQDGDIKVNATSLELEQIRNYLETGFYYE